MSEALDQFIRRVSACVKVYDVDNNGDQSFSIAMSDTVAPEEKQFPDDYHSRINSVTMHYGFPNEQVTDRDDIIYAATELVIHNHARKALEVTLKKAGCTLKLGDD